MINFYIAAFLADFALGVVLLSLPLLLIYRFEASSLTLGLFGALGALIYSSGVVAFGRLSDRMNRRTVLLSGCVLFVVSYLILPLSHDIKCVFALYIPAAFSMALFWPTIQSWLSQGLDKKALLRSLKYFNIFWCAGLTFGFLISGFLFSIDYKAPFFFGVTLLCIVFFILLRQPIVSETEDEPARKVFIQTENDRPKESERYLYIAWFANFASWYIVGTVRNIFPKLGIELGFSSGFIGILIFIMMLAQTFVFFILGKTARWHYRLTPLVACQALALLALAILMRNSGVVYLMIAFFLLGISGGMTYFSSIFYSLYGFIDKGKRSGLHEGFIGAGAFLGPLVGGVTAGTLGIRTPYVFAFFMLVIIIIFEISMARGKIRIPKFPQ
ncbi:MAG: MFS transporter [Candidatus Omnitrophica bacterium]|nr:MFS transporter [Candidatus Omnitrophota bacterium]